MAKNKLKPCPFCGNKDLQELREGNTFSIYCQNCGGNVTNYSNKEWAIDAWNRRTNNAQYEEGRNRNRSHP